MKTSLQIVVLFGLQFAAFAQPVQRQWLHGQVPAAVAQLQPLGRLAATNVLHLVIGLPLRNREGLTNLLQRLYDPASPDYHHYLTPDQFTERFGPTREDYRRLSDFAIANRLTVTSTHPNRTLLDVSGSVDDVERVFHLALHVYRHPKEPRTFFAPDVEPSLELAVPVLWIGGLDTYALPRPAGLKVKGSRHGGGASNGKIPNNLFGSGPTGDYMGYDFRSAYVPGVSLTGSGQSVGLLECDGYYTADITSYESQAGLPNVALRNVLLDGFNGIPEDPNAVLEVSLDIEMAVSMAPGLSNVIVYETFADTPAYIYDLVNRMATDNQAKQLSSSWVFRNDASLDQIFEQFALQGQSFFEASGDQDAYTAGTFQFNDDPYVTLVGGTTLSTSGARGAWQSETVWNWGIEFGSGDDGEGSGGGISTTYLIPTWQQGISMSANGGSRTMRNIPDVALTADNIFVVGNGVPNDGVGGTSCAAPLWAGFTALVNQQAVGNGFPAVGFINPAIYAIGRGPGYALAFHDITTGNNTWSGSPNQFYAVPGYDLCTGWGSPAGSNLINTLAPVDVLRISPSMGFASSGGVGGPFTVTSQNYSLTNAGTTALSWILTNSAPWLSVSPSSGTLTPGGAAATVVVTLDAAASNLVVGSYSSSISFSNQHDGVVQARLAVLNIVAPPIITNSPASQGALDGATVLLTVGVDGAPPLSFQWRKNGADLTDGANLSGSATAGLTISNVSSLNVGSYDVVVANAAGAVTSAPAAILSITASKPVIVSQPASQTAVISTAVQFTVAAIGNPPFSYQWYFDNATVTNATSATLPLVSVTTNQAGTYSVVVSDSLGSTLSSNATLTVVPPSLVQNGGFELGNFTDWTSSGNFTYSSVTTNPPYVHSGSYGAELGPSGMPGYLSQTLATTVGQTYQISCWLYCDGEQPNEFSVSWNGATLFDQQNIGDTGWTNLQFQANAIATNTVLTFGFRDDSSYLGLDDITVFAISAPPAVLTQPSSAIVPVGGIATFSIVASGSAPLSYAWLRANLPIAGATASSYTTNPVQFADSGSQFSCRVSNAFGTALSSMATLTVVSNLPTTNVVFVRSSAGDPWGLDDDEVALTTVFGTNWQTAYYETVNPPTLFSPSTSFIFMEGSQVDASDMAAFLSANLALMSNWVAAGGSLFINAAPLVNGNIFGIGVSSIYLGFGVTLFPDLDFDGTAAAPAHPIFNGPNLPVATAFTGDYFSHALLSGPGLTALLTNSTGNVSLAELAGGPGRLLFGGMTLPGYHQPQPQSSNLLANVLSYGAGRTRPGPPSIIVPPVGQTAFTGGSATFCVTASGSPPLSYSWLRNNVPLGAPNAACYTINNVQLSDSGSQFSCLVSNTDGMALSSSATLTVLPPSLVQDGGFELGTFNDWTSSGNFAGCSVTPNAPYVHSGVYGAQLGPSGSLGYLAQTLATTVGQAYQISCWLYCNGGQPNEFSVSWNGATLFDQQNIGDTGWTNLQFQASATAAATVLTFGFRDDPSFLGLDDIIVYPLSVSTNGPPMIVTQPASQAEPLGSAASFSVLADGQLPLFYQWQFGGANLVHATNATLLLTNLTSSQAGSYQVLVSNSLGSAASSIATLTVVLPTLVQNGGFELGTFNDWTSSGNLAGCSVTPNVPYVHSGVYGAQLGPSGTPGFLSQALATSVGQTYQISCWLYCNGEQPNQFSVSWNGATLLDQQNIGATGWTNLQFWVSATETSTVLEFGFLDDPSYFGLDDIGVAPSGPTVGFTANPTNGVVPLAVSFTSASVDSGGNSITSWSWAFGDGSTSTARNPSHTYTTAGTFSPALMAINSLGGAVSGLGPSITASPLTLQYTASPTNGVVPLAVQFASPGVDSAGHTITSWNWTFGDGSTSSAQNPSHTYATVGAFSPALIATNNLGATVTGFGPAFITAFAAPVYSGLVLNGGFETGDLTGWTLSGLDTNDIFVDNGFQTGINPHSGSYLAALGPVGSVSYLSQTLATTPGAPYSLSFWLNSPDGSIPNEFLVSWNGHVLFDEVNLPEIAGWTNLQFVVVATGSSTVLQFGSRDDNSFLGLDDLSVVPSGPTVAFTAHPTSGVVPLAVSFTSAGIDSAGNTISRWNWNFGDGSTSIAQNPSHTYTTAGTFYPALIATNNLGGTVTGIGPSITATSPFTTLYSFTDGNDGAYPDSALILSGTTLYGTAYEGGNSGNGTVFALTTNGTAFTALYSFSAIDANGFNNDGTGPNAVILSGNTLYGTAYYGGTSGNGTVFKVNTDGTGFTTLHSFSATDANGFNNDGANPFAGVILSGNTLYGTAQGGGSSGNGTVFAVNTTGTGFTTLHSFSATDANGFNNDGVYPFAGLILSGNTLYGAADAGGRSGNGTVFAVNTTGTAFTTLYSFSATGANGFNNDGANPYAGLIVSGNALYGTAQYGGNAGNGTVFSVNTNGAGFATLYSFSATSANGLNNDGANPEGGLILSGNTLYGTAASGGILGGGTAFAVNTNGAGFTNLHNLAGSDGANPVAALLLSGDTLYGTALNGGSLGDGTAFSLILPSGPTVAFTANPTNGVVPLAVSFTSAAVDSAGNSITSWNWTFGDGSTNTAQNPSHTYATAGTFSPALIATNNIGGTVTGSGPASITATSAPAQPGIASVSLSGTNLVLNATNGQSGAAYYVLMSTNLVQWTRVATNVLTAGGNFTLTVTNAVTRAVPQRFYILETP